MDLRSGAAFWPLRNGLIRSYPALDRDEAADVVVIGAGVTGALVAHRLVAAGASVVVLDRRDVASGSTAATTGLLLYETDTSLVELSGLAGERDAARAWRLGREAIDGIERLCAELGDPCGFARRPSLYLASTDRDAATLAGEHALRVAHGFDVERLTRDDLLSRYAIDRPAALRTPDAGQIDAFRFTHRVLEAAAARGVRIYDRTEAEDVVADADGVTVSTARGPRVRARRLVWAAGYETIEYVPKRIGRMSSTWAFVSEPVSDLRAWRECALVWETARPYLYLRATDDGRVMAGGEDEPFSRRHENLRRLHRKTETLRARVAGILPDVPLETAYSWAGVFSTTTDGLPYIGEASDHPHAWFALGYGGNGITFAMIAADLIRDAWLGRANPDATIFRFGRHRRFWSRSR